jgi:hypothetical protein
MDSPSNPNNILKLVVFPLLRVCVVSFTSSFPTNLPKFSAIAVKVVKYTYVCNILLKYVELYGVVDPENHRRVFDALKCVAVEVSDWSRKVEEFTG